MQSPPAEAPAHNTVPAPHETPRLTPHASPVPRACWLVACLLAALAQVALAGYQLGVGNQTIQIPFLKRAIDPTLYPRDEMVNRTIGDYPSFFYPVVAQAVKAVGLIPAYFWLHVATTFFVLAGVFALTRGMFRTARDAYLTAAVAVTLVLAGHHHALAGDELYSLGFTHTYAVLPLAILGLSLTYRDKLTGAWLVVGILFNSHALTAAYLAAPLAVVTLLDVRQNGWKWAARGPLLALVVALPTLLVLATHRQQFDELWVALTYVRSADHSFPSSWWRTGSTEVPRFALLMGLAALSFSWPTSRRAVRTSLIVAGVIGGLFLVGYAFAEIWPVPTVLRAQLFRASRLLLVVAVAHIAHGIVEGLLEALRLFARRTGKGVATGALELLAAVGVLAAVACPALDVLLPHALLLATLAALAAGRLSWVQAVAASAALLVALWAWKTIGFVIPGLHAETLAATLKHFHSDELRPVTWVSASALAAAGCLIIAPRGLSYLRRAEALSPKGRAVTVLALGALGLGLFALAAPAQYAASVTSQSAGTGPEWVDVQQWARENTPPTALFVTPPSASGFRILSERSVVAEYRDGTQLYFTAAFAKDWLDRLTRLRPDARLDGRKLTPGRRLDSLTDAELVELAKSFGATHVVLPAAAPTPHRLKEAYRNAAWVVYTPEVVAAKPARQLAYSRGQWKPVEEAAPATQPTTPATRQAVSRPTTGPATAAVAGATQPGAGRTTPTVGLAATTRSAPTYIVTRPEGPAPEYAWVPYGETEPLPWLANESFMKEIVLPNIERYRKSDAALTILDEAGAPVADARFAAVQKTRRFDFGVSLPFFEPVATPRPGDDYKPAPVKPVELERFKEAGFNFSMIPFSAKWAYLEPEEGKPHYGDLDKYVAWAGENGVNLEFHFLTGLPPAWLPQVRPDVPLTDAERAKVRAAVLAHTRDMVTRYKDKIKYWQVMNDWHPRQLAFDALAPELFAEIRKIVPDAKLGLSDCARLTSSSRGVLREEDLCRGITQVRILQAKGVKVDYFAPHAHQPYGLWPDAGEMYEAFDTWQKAGVKVHISEAFVPMGERVPAGTPGAVTGRGPGLGRGPRPGFPGRMARPGSGAATQPETRAAARPAPQPAATAASRPASLPSPQPATQAVTQPGAQPAAADPPMSPAIIYGIRKGRWDRDLQAEHFERFLTICFSHPAVEAVNLWCLGPDSRMTGEGILDQNYDPTPAFEAIQKLLRETFTTRYETATPLDGRVAFRGFHGDYAVTVTLETGETFTATLALEPGEAPNLRLRLNRATHTLDVVK